MKTEEYMKRKKQIKRIAYLFIFTAFIALALTGCKKRVKDEPASSISMDDAKSLVDEKLEDTDCSSEFSEKAEVDGKDYYLFNITNEGEYLDQMLAVEAISGTVYTYNDEDRTISDYSDFEYYMAEYDDSLTWAGTYTEDDTVLVIDDEDPGSFSFQYYFKDADEPVTGYGSYENATTGKAEFNDENLTFKLKDYMLTVTSDDPGTAYDGEFEKQ